MRHLVGARPERLLALDIETVPDRERLPPEWKDKFAKPIFHEIACISFVEADIAIDEEGCERTTNVSCRSGGEVGWTEPEILRAFWSFFARYALLSGRTDRAGYDAAIAGLVTYLDRERATGRISGCSSTAGGRPRRVWAWWSDSDPDDGRRPSQSSPGDGRRSLIDRSRTNCALPDQSGDPGVVRRQIR